ncbi:basement membrane-specific heparan sulfate proteoglycan core protein-like [Cyprinodon tularosa]|uniref:basement membrane-specific heparan sulfate proteoglycan core protein-like n=1 Tax=Cyprinodon tularosa TaxID=77115 RepID=UPI0018E230AE|nr:basement membrane-specific heparan sulfate proteoglycan core protein-like [Cyprinodon tularosa]
MGHTLLCRLGFFLICTLCCGYAEEHESKATLTANITEIPAGSSAKLTCSVDKPAGLKYELFKRTSSTDQTKLEEQPDGRFRVSEGGIYTCRGYETERYTTTSLSNEVVIYATVSKPTVTLQPNWYQIFKGEKVTLRCEIHGGGGAQWTYEWRPTSRNSPTSSEYRITAATESYSGEYRCRARRDYQVTDWSNAFSMTVEDKPTPSLKAGDEIIPLGGSVTLTCSVFNSTGWKFDWFRQKSESSGAQLIRNNEPNGVISISEGGLYSCRGRRGDPAFYTKTSSKVIIYKTVSEPTVTLQPNWSHIFRGEKVTLRCEIHGGGGAQWTYEWRPTSRNSPTSSKYRITAATESDSGEYRCSARGDYQITAWSDAFSLTVRADKPTASLTADQEIIPLRGSVTLTCSVSSSTGWKFDWFRQKSESSGAQPIRNNKPDGVIRISEGGLYSCRGGRGDPVFYTENSNKVTIYKTVPIIPNVILQPNWPQIFRGEKVTLRCEIHGGGGAQWTYEWSSTNRNSPTSSEYRITAADSGEYRCRGRTDVFTITEWGVLRLAVSGEFFFIFPPCLNFLRDFNIFCIKVTYFPKDSSIGENKLIVNKT